MVTVCPPAARTRLVRSSQPVTGSPSRATMTSPGRSPAAAAALRGSPGAQARCPPVAGSASHSATAHGLTDSTVGAVRLSLSKSLIGANANTPHSSAKPSTKCTAEPAPITIVRFHTGYRHIARCCWPSGTSSSCGVIPTILTKPPTGSALIPYSVSPRRNDHRVGPNPTKYRVASMPNAFAVPRWPASWRQIDTTMPRANRTTPTANSIGSATLQPLPSPAGRAVGSHLAGRPSGDLPHAGTRPRLGSVDLLDRTRFGQFRRTLEHPRHRVDDAQERQPVRQERGHALLVGRVVDRRP